jgi:hypothetical protein
MTMQLTRFPVLMLLVSLGQGPEPAEAQQGWRLAIVVSRDAFTGASRDTSILDTPVEIGPAPRLAVDLGLERATGSWGLGVTAGYAGGSLRAKSSGAIFEDRTGGMDRWRVGVLARRRVIQFEHAALFLALSPSLDRWTISGIGDHTTWSIRGGMILCVPIAGMVLENRALVGVGGSPFGAADLPASAERRRFTSWSFGAGLQLPL